MGRKLPTLWKMAAMLEVCPKDVKGVSCQIVDEVGEDYDKLRHKIATWTANQVVQERSDADGRWKATATGRKRMRSASMRLVGR